MWGAPGTGKTTFLGVLDIALNRKDYGLTMTGANEASVDLLIEMTEIINDNREFPPATQSIDTFKWDLFTVQPPQSSVQPAKVTLKLTDPSGELMRSAQRSDPDRKQLIDEIVRQRRDPVHVRPDQGVREGRRVQHHQRAAEAAHGGLLQQRQGHVQGQAAALRRGLHHEVRRAADPGDRPRA